MLLSDSPLKYEQHYSHGLEAIYTLEEVDATTIRKVSPELKRSGLEEKGGKEAPLELFLGPEFAEAPLPFHYHKWVELLVKNEDPYAMSALLQKYGLESAVALTARQHNETKRMPEERKMRLAQEGKVALLESCRAKEAIKNHLATHIVPWMRKRGGIAAAWELEERFISLTERMCVGEDVLLFLKETLFEEESLFSTRFISLGRGVWGCDDHVMRLYERGLSLVLSYFYRPQLIYPLVDLVTWVQEEVAPSWELFPQGFLERLLFVTPEFATFVKEGRCFVGVGRLGKGSTAGGLQGGRSSSM